MRQRAAVFLALALTLAVPAGAQDVRLPNKDGSFKFAIIGDTGTGSREQNEVGRQMAVYHQRFAFPFVVMVGDNMYGSQRPADFLSKFEGPYKDLIGQGVKFYAALGNHDEPSQKAYSNFNMGGERFYTFKPTAGVRFFALDSNYMDKTQLDWLETQFRQSGSEWKICFFHHPLYSSARRHGSTLDLRSVLEPLLVKYGVSVVFAGHDHVYERIKPQKGIYHFVSGAGGSLRKGDLRRGEFTAAGFDQDFHFMLAEIDGDEMHFQAVSRTGTVVDAGVFKRPGAGAAAAAPSPAPASPSPSPSPKPKPRE